MTEEGLPLPGKFFKSRKQNPTFCALLGLHRPLWIYHRWCVFIIVCMVTMLDFGIIFSLGAMFVAMKETYQSDRSSTATVQSLLIGISLSFSVISGGLISKYGLRAVTTVASFLVPIGFCISFLANEIHYLYITISVISGIGISSIHVAGVVMIQQMFPTQQHPLCFAIHGIGVNLSGIVYPLLIAILIEKYGVRGTFLVLGGIFMNSFAVPLILLNDLDNKNVSNPNNVTLESVSEESENEEETMLTAENTKENCTNNKDNIKDQLVDNLGDDVDDDVETVANTETGEFLESKTDQEVKSVTRFSSLQRRPYIFLLFASALCMPALNTFLGFTVDIFVWKGFTVSEGLFSFIPFNVLSLLSKFIPVLAKKFNKRLSCFVLPICYCMCGFLGQLLICVTNNYISLLIGTSFTGLALGGVFPTALIAGAEIVRKDDWPVASGLLMTFIGVLSSGFAPLFGTFRDVTGSYTGAIAVTGCLQLAGAVLYLLAFFSNKPAKDKAS